MVAQVCVQTLGNNIIVNLIQNFEESQPFFLRLYELCTLKKINRDHHQPQWCVLD